MSRSAREAIAPRQWASSARQLAAAPAVDGPSPQSWCRPGSDGHRRFPGLPVLQRGLVCEREDEGQRDARRRVLDRCQERRRRTRQLGGRVPVACSRQAARPSASDAGGGHGGPERPPQSQPAVAAARWRRTPGPTSRVTAASASGNAWRVRWPARTPLLRSPRRRWRRSAGGVAAAFSRTTQSRTPAPDHPSRHDQPEEAPPRHQRLGRPREAPP